VQHFLSLSSLEVHSRLLYGGNWHLLKFRAEISASFILVQNKLRIFGRRCLYNSISRWSTCGILIEPKLPLAGGADYCPADGQARNVFNTGKCFLAGARSVAAGSGGHTNLLL
jgi:hypothetical protein